MVTMDIPVTTEPATEADPFSSSVAGIVNSIGPSVVQLHSHGRGGGAGVIWRPNGHILTNNHVLGPEGGAVGVLLPDGRTLGAVVVARDAELDLALLAVAANDLAAASIGDSSRLRVGELVFAVGHPWGQRGVVTMGIVSALGAVPVAGGAREVDYIRSDVQLAPGNSGGPLLDAHGAVIGINAMIFGGDLAVAIPSHVVEAWLATAPRRPIVLGLQLQRVPLPATLRQSAPSGRTAGLLVAAVDARSLAELAGVLVGDVLLDVDRTPVESFAALRRALARDPDAGTLELRILRGGLVRDLALRPRADDAA